MQGGEGHGPDQLHRGREVGVAFAGWLRGSFWALNVGLALMALLTLLPLGVLQLSAVLEHGYWYARSAEFMSQPIVHLLIWMRVPGDTLFAIGALLYAWFVLRLWVARRRGIRVVASSAGING